MLLVSNTASFVLCAVYNGWGSIPGDDLRYARAVGVFVALSGQFLARVLFWLFPGSTSGFYSQTSGLHFWPWFFSRQRIYIYIYIYMYIYIYIQIYIYRERCI